MFALREMEVSSGCATRLPRWTMSRAHRRTAAGGSRAAPSPRYQARAATGKSACRAARPCRWPAIRSSGCNVQGSCPPEVAAAASPAGIQQRCLLSTSRPSSAPPPAPRIVPIARSPWVSIARPRRAPTPAPTINPVVPLVRHPSRGERST